MATIRDFDQMLQAALELKATAQKFIDFAKLQGAGDGGEGEEDLVDAEDNTDTNDQGDGTNVNDTADTTDTTPKGKNAAIIIALKKKMGK